MASKADSASGSNDDRSNASAADYSLHDSVEDTPSTYSGGERSGMTEYSAAKKLLGDKDYNNTLNDYINK